MAEPPATQHTNKATAHTHTKLAQNKTMKTTES